MNSFNYQLWHWKLCEVTIYVSMYVQFNIITGPSYSLWVIGFFIVISPNQTSWKGTFAYKNCMLIQRMQKDKKVQSLSVTGDMVWQVKHKKLWFHSSLIRSLVNLQSNTLSMIFLHGFVLLSQDNNIIICVITIKYWWVQTKMEIKTNYIIVSSHQYREKNKKILMWTI